VAAAVEERGAEEREEEGKEKEVAAEEEAAVAEEVAAEGEVAAEVGKKKLPEAWKRLALGEGIWYDTPLPLLPPCCDAMLAACGL